MESCPIEIEQDISVDQQELKELFDKACSQTFSTEKKYYGNCCETTLKFRFLVINGPNDEKECAIHIYMEIHLDYDEMELDEKYYGKIAFYNKSSKFVFHSNKDSIFKSGENWYSDEKCEMTDILNPEKKFFDNGKFTLQMKGLLFRDKSEEKQIFQTTLGQHLWERDDRDFVISVGKNGEDKTEIKIHKLVFASRSPVFDAMLKAEMKEKQLLTSFMIKKVM
uniref:BTB domain-containing protein n=1 Tax=Panagrolaimus superbus TaxID=310955 RepID=A0A914XTJ6_9BILA